MDVYRTMQGDMWDSVAWKTMGSETYASELMWLNRKYLSYFTFPAGITLILPEKTARVNAALPPWKQVPG